LRKTFPPQVVTLEDNRSRLERRAIATRAVTPEQIGLAGSQQLAQIQRTRTFTSPTFVADHISNTALLAVQVDAPPDPLTQALRSALPSKVRKKVLTETDAVVTAALVKGLNKLANGPSLYDPVRFPEKVLSLKTREFRDQNPKPKGQKLAQFNRLLLCDAYPKAISTEPKTEIDWLATSRKPDKMGVEAFLGNNRQYWGIENGTPQRLDCSVLEDQLRVHDPNAVAILGLFHRISINLFMAWAKKQPNQRDRTFPTWQSEHLANRWIMIHQITKAPG
jgi:hypothetical protein